MKLMHWYPTPSYLVKRKVILDFLTKIDFKDFLEVGCGAGDLLVSLAHRGYGGVGIDISAEAIEAAKERLKSTAISAEQKQIDDVDGTFDVVIASEVLEHCEDDLGFLGKLTTKISPGGYLVLTVPAHMHKWGANDDFSGHVRRYERAELKQKIGQAGLDLVHIYSYGVPIYNLMKPFYDRAIRKKVNEEEILDDRTKKSSGMWLFPALKALFYLLFNDITMLPFYITQRMFFNTDFGNGYFVVAKKK